MPQTISINNCLYAEGQKAGDTLLILQARVGDTLAITFSLNAGAGLAWDLDTNRLQKDIIELVNQSFHTVNLGENRQKWIFLYSLVIRKKQGSYLDFWLRRGLGNNYGHCCIKTNPAEAH
ncbi:hypothetical protein D3H65_06195 [Paraflavitalea soli]|uniref:Proteinase inhibitor I42 chagasin domain-containing protein n=1 Tax=Paraflavitalea soli TaxID=2315862 RepID=A0A3B7MKN3_9BACT|nr:hypothetical protein [Paraflavitalea soli]AXY73596.1 hypothetical protein D3H65_06195 [Paraflavitalea soli]